MAAFFENSERVFALNAVKCQGTRCDSGTVAPLSGLLIPIATGPLSGNGKAGVRFEAQVRIPVWLRSSDSELFRSRFSVNEKDEASLMNHFHQDSLDAFIPRFAGVWRFFIFQAPRWSPNCKIVS